MVSKLIVNSNAPNFSAATSVEQIDFYDWLGENWGIIYSHFEDFCPNVTGESISQIGAEFNLPNLKIIGYSQNSIEFGDISIIHDSNQNVTKKYSNAEDERVVYLINPQKTVAFAAAKSKVNGITKFSSSQNSEHTYDGIIHRIFGKLWP